MSEPKIWNSKLFQRLNADFLEKDDVVIAVILEADVALERARAMLRLEIEFALGDGLAFGVVSDGDVVKHHDGARSIEGDEHGVPLGAGLAGFGERLGERVERASDMIIVFVRILGMIVNLDLVAVVDGHPLFAGLDGNANEDAR